MSKKVGIWIDHGKAFIVGISGEEENKTIIESNVDGRIRLSGGSRSRTPFGPQEVVSEKKMEERRKHQLGRYYKEILQVIGDASKLFIFGPGEAKIELEKEIKKNKELSAKVVGIETADRMTEPQIVAKVKKFFSPTP